MSDTAAMRFPTHWVGAIYQAMCVAFGPELIRAFWRNHRCVDGETLPLAELFRLLMDRDATVPAKYDYTVTNALELFMLEHGVEPDDFVRFASYMSSYHPFYSPQQILFRATKPIVAKLATLYDPRQAVVTLLQQVTSSIMPGHIAKRVKTVDKRTYVIVLRLPDGDKFPFRHDYHYYCRIQIMHAPSIFDYPPFSGWVPLSDARPLEACLNAGERVAMENGVVTVNGARIGKVVPSFVEACRERHDVAIGKSTVRDCPVVLVEREYRCPVRGRVVLAEGCLYDAPYYLARISYDPIPVQRDDYVKRLLTLVTNADRVADKRVNEMHARLTANSIRVVYHDEHQLCDIEAADADSPHDAHTLLSLSGTEARILSCLASRLADADSSALTVPCTDVIRDVYDVRPHDSPRRYRSFYVSLKRLTAKIKTQAADGLRMRTVSAGRSKRVEITCPSGSFEYCRL
ncbi:MAG: hypothetical protein GF331_22070 [Chitinivibrionales bacterium]|nr:hypothetical protein [Chitinivibrionales bacterium]